MEYHQDFSSISKTMLTLFKKDRVKYKHTYVTGEMLPIIPSVPMLSGIVKHCMALEGASVDDLVLVYPDECLNINKDINPKPAKAFREANPGAVIVKPKERDELVKLANNVLQSSDLQEFIGKDAIVEERFDAVIEGVKCKCKPDVMREMPEWLNVYDLKFPKVLTKDSFERTNKGLAYWLQDSHYTAILERIFKKPVRFCFLNIETQFPHRVLPKWFDDKVTRPAAKTEHLKLLRSLRECMETGVYENDWQSEVIMSPWDFQVDPDELVEVE